MNPRSKTGERLVVHPHCLMFFVEETGHEEFSDSDFPVFGVCGCGLLAAAIDQNLRQPWREMKARHFGGADAPLHASELRSPTSQQVEALRQYFERHPFGRFAVTMTSKTKLPDGIKPIQIMPGLLRRRGRL